MSRSELVARIAEQNQYLYPKEVEAVVDTVLDTITSALARGDRVELHGFGMFEARSRPARVRRNPRSQAKVELDPGSAVRFKPAKAMRDRLNSKARQSARGIVSTTTASGKRNRSAGTTRGLSAAC